jgi:hypothetical protein
MRSPLVALALALLIPALAAAQTKPRRPPPELHRSVLQPAPAPLSPPLAERLGFHETSLGRLGAHDKGRIWRGSLQLGLGAGSGVAAIFVDDPGGRAVLALGGAVAIGRGVAQLAVKSGAQPRAAEFAALPAQNEELVRRKLLFGETALAQLARAERRARQVDGSLGMLGAVGLVPLYWGLSRHDDPAYRFGDYAFDYVSLSLSVIGFAASLVQMIVGGEAEQRYRAYRALP